MTAFNPPEIQLSTVFEKVLDVRPRQTKWLDKGSLLSGNLVDKDFSQTLGEKGANRELQHTPFVVSSVTQDPFARQNTQDISEIQPMVITTLRTQQHTPVQQRYTVSTSTAHKPDSAFRITPSRYQSNRTAYETFTDNNRRHIIRMETDPQYENPSAEPASSGSCNSTQRTHLQMRATPGTEGHSLYPGLHNSDDGSPLWPRLKTLRQSASRNPSRQHNNRSTYLDLEEHKTSYINSLPRDDSHELQWFSPERQPATPQRLSHREPGATPSQERTPTPRHQRIQSDLSITRASVIFQAQQSGILQYLANEPDELGRFPQQKVPPCQTAQEQTELTLCDTSVHPTINTESVKLPTPSRSIMGIWARRRKYSESRRAAKEVKKSKRAEKVDKALRLRAEKTFHKEQVVQREAEKTEPLQQEARQKSINELSAVRRGDLDLELRHEQIKQMEQLDRLRQENEQKREANSAKQKIADKKIEQANEASRMLLPYWNLAPKEAWKDHSGEKLW